MCNTLVSKAEGLDAKFVMQLGFNKLRYNIGKQNLEKNIDDFHKKILDTSGSLKKTDVMQKLLKIKSLESVNYSVMMHLIQKLYILNIKHQMLLS